MKINNILFDLDGTLTDPKQGVVGSFQYALEKLGRPVPPSNELLWCIGPPLLDSFQKVLGNGNGDDAQTALSLYRERYGRIGKFENQVYDGIFEVLIELQKMGLTLYIATAKPYVFAKEICDHFQLSEYFRKIYGPSLTGALSDKGDLIAHMLNEEHLRAKHTIMIGDRKFDMAAAARNHVKTVGALYGYGSEMELKDAGADYMIQTPRDIPGLIKRIKGRGL
jgi:phosphoglycolate phosphatase